MAVPLGKIGQRELRSVLRSKAIQESLCKAMKSLYAFHTLNIASAQSDETQFFTIVCIHSVCLRKLVKAGILCFSHGLVKGISEPRNAIGAPTR